MTDTATITSLFITTYVICFTFVTLLLQPVFEFLPKGIHYKIFEAIFVFSVIITSIISLFLLIFWI